MKAMKIYLGIFQVVFLVLFACAPSENLFEKIERERKGQGLSLEEKLERAKELLKDKRYASAKELFLEVNQNSNPEDCKRNKECAWCESSYGLFISAGLSVIESIQRVGGGQVLPSLSQKQVENLDMVFARAISSVLQQVVQLSRMVDEMIKLECSGRLAFSFTLELFGPLSLNVEFEEDDKLPPDLAYFFGVIVNLVQGILYIADSQKYALQDEVSLREFLSGLTQAIAGQKDFFQVVLESADFFAKNPEFLTLREGKDRNFALALYSFSKVLTYAVDTLEGAGEIFGEGSILGLLSPAIESIRRLFEKWAKGLRGENQCIVGENNIISFIQPVTLDIEGREFAENWEKDGCIRLAEDLTGAGFLSFIENLPTDLIGIDVSKLLGYNIVINPSALTKPFSLRALLPLARKVDGKMVFAVEFEVGQDTAHFGGGELYWLYRKQGENYPKISFEIPRDCVVSSDTQIPYIPFADPSFGGAIGVNTFFVSGGIFEELVAEKDPVNSDECYEWEKENGIANFEGYSVFNPSLYTDAQQKLNTIRNGNYALAKILASILSMLANLSIP